MKKNYFLLFVALVISLNVFAQNTVELLKKATTYREKWDYENTVRYLDEAEKSYPDNLSLTYIKANYLADFSKYSQAIPVFQILQKREVSFLQKTITRY